MSPLMILFSQGRSKTKVVCAQSCLILCDLMDCNPPGSALSMGGFSRQEYWSGLPFPLPGDLPDPGIALASPASPLLAGVVFTATPPGKTQR